MLRAYNTCNDGDAPGVNVQVSIPRPSVGTYVSHIAQAGTFDTVNFIWTIPIVPVGTCYTLQINFATSGDSCNTNLPCNTVQPAPVANTVDITHQIPRVVQGGIPSNALCTTGTNLIEVSNEVNCTVEMQNGGTYTTTVTDLSQPWSFDYTVECICGASSYGPFGPSTVQSEAATPPPSTAEVFEFDGGETSVVVAATLPVNSVNLFVTLMGTLLYEGTHYTITGQTLNLNFTANAGELMEVRIIY